MSVSRVLVLALLALAVLVPLATTAGAAEGYLMYPDLHGDRVVFTSEEDLWLAPADGGEARRLSSHVGLEAVPRFSPDGSSIAFTGHYDGNGDVFVIPAEGGEPRRLTWHPALDVVIGWTPDGSNVIFASAQEHPHGSDELFAVPAAGGDVEKLPLGWATYLDVEPAMGDAGGRWAFTRTDGGGTWKRYRGGRAETIWVGDPQRRDYREVTRFDGMNAFPMWHDGRIYYLCDAGGTANLWSMAPDGSDLRRHTDFGDWDARYPSMAPDGRIVFMLAGGLRIFDPASGDTRQVAIDLPSDRVLTRNRYPDAAGDLTALDLSPDGERVAVTTRGEIFSVPVEDGVTLPVTRGSGHRESWATFSADGERLVYVSDATGEEDVRSLDAWGRGEPTVLRPAAASGWHYPPAVAPHGERLAWSDSDNALWVQSGDGAPAEVDRGGRSAILDYVWSPDGRWLAYSKLASTDYGSIYLYDADAGTTHRVTDGSTNDHEPAWDPEGRYLYFLSDRRTNPLLGTRDLEHVNIDPTRPYLALLRADVDNPFADTAGLPPAEDDGGEEAAAEETTEKAEDDEAGADAPQPVEIDLEGLGQRIVELPVDGGLYSNLLAAAGKVFYLSQPMVGMADWGPLFGGGGPQASLVAFDLKSETAETWVEGVAGGAGLLGNVAGVAPRVRGDKLLFMKAPGEVYVVGTAAKPGDLSDARVDMGGVVVEVDPDVEWAQIFHEAWRQMRDYYWDPGLGGLDWDAIGARYASLLPRLTTRSELGDLIAEMIGELSTSHTYVFGGDPGKRVPHSATGLLGVDVTREGQAFRIERIYHGAPADDEPAPLRMPGVDVAEGDYVLAVNHRPFATDRPFTAAFEGLAGKAVVLTVNDGPGGDGARDVVVTPLGSDSGLRYADWVRRNRERVAAETDGKIGYVHVPDMMADGLIEFNTWFYPQLDKEGMVVDVRWNGGGFVSQMILERLRRPLVSVDRQRSGAVSTYPYRVLNGPFVVLTNQFAGSDGDIFPAAVQLEGLAPVIGERSWGGVVGISSLRPLVDGGILTQPQSAWWDTQSGWGLENRGVVPDVEVENLPQELARGEDAQLERAIREVLRLHAEEPPVTPDFGPVPPRTRDSRQHELDELLGEGGGG